MAIEKLIKEFKKYEKIISKSDLQKIEEILEKYRTNENITEKSSSPIKLTVEDEIKNLEIAESLKKEGNVLFQKQKYEKAAEKYSQAIEKDPLNKILYSNRAACYAKLQKNEQGIEDAKKAIEIDPTYAKAYARLGTFYFHDNSEESLKYYEKALEYDPSNSEYKNTVQNLSNKLQKNRNNDFKNQDDSNFNISDILNNPDMMKYAEELLKNKSPEEIEQMKNMFQDMMKNKGNK